MLQLFNVFIGNPSQSCTERHLRVTCHPTQMNAPRLNSSQIVR